MPKEQSGLKDIVSVCFPKPSCGVVVETPCTKWSRSSANQHFHACFILAVKIGLGVSMGGFQKEEDT